MTAHKTLRQMYRDLLALSCCHAQSDGAVFAAVARTLVMHDAVGDTGVTADVCHTAVSLCVLSGSLMSCARQQWYVLNLPGRPTCWLLLATLLLGQAAVEPSYSATLVRRLLPVGACVICVVQPAMTTSRTALMQQQLYCLYCM